MHGDILDTALTQIMAPGFVLQTMVVAVVTVFGFLLFCQICVFIELERRHREDLEKLAKKKAPEQNNSGAPQP